MSSYKPPYLSFHAFTCDRPVRQWTQTGLTLFWLLDQDEKFSYRSHVNHNKFQTGSRNVKPVCFWVSHVFITKNILFHLKSRHQESPPGFMWTDAKISYRCRSDMCIPHPPPLQKINNYGQLVLMDGNRWTQIRHDFFKVPTLETIYLQLNHLPQSEL